MYIKKIVPLGTNKVATSLTTRDSNFEALVDNDKIYVLNKNNDVISIKNLNNSYGIFTFDDYKKEYVMVPKSGTIKRVNTNLEEFDEFKVSKPFEDKVDDIFFDILNNRYLILEKKRVYSVDPNGKYLKSEVNSNDFYSVRVVNTCGCIKKEIEPSDFMFTAIGSDASGKYVAYNKNNSAYLAMVSENGSKMDEIFLGDNLKVNSIVSNNGLYLNVGKDGVDYLYELSISDGSISGKLQDIISNLNSLIDKISFTETQIGSLISAEADKIKKVLSETTDLNLIINTNESVSTVINGLAQVELGERDNLALIIQAINELEKIIQKEENN